MADQKDTSMENFAKALTAGSGTGTSVSAGRIYKIVEKANKAGEPIWQGKIAGKAYLKLKKGSSPRVNQPIVRLVESGKIVRGKSEAFGNKLLLFTTPYFNEHKADLDKVIEWKVEDEG